MKFLLASAACLFLALACISPVDYADDRVRETTLQLQQDYAEARQMLIDGEITQEQFDELAAQAKKIAEDELASIPDEVREMVLEQRDDFRERGKGFLMSLTNLLLLIGLGGGAGAIGVVGVQKQRKTGKDA